VFIWIEFELGLSVKGAKMKNFGSVFLKLLRNLGLGNAEFRVAKELLIENFQLIKLAKNIINHHY
jgi:hypothetical protein